MDGPDFLVAVALLARFDGVEFIRGDQRIVIDGAAVNSGDIMWSQ